jgi:hypothetical protein
MLLPRNRICRFFFFFFFIFGMVGKLKLDSLTPVRPWKLTMWDRAVKETSSFTVVLARPPKETNVLSLFRLNGKVAVVTAGGTRGIGLGASKAMAEAGANVAIIYTSYPKS